MGVDALVAPPDPETRVAAHKVGCRPVEAEDLPAVVDLLQTAFPRRDRRYWERGLQRLARREPPPAFPRFGDVLTLNGRPIGLHLLISAPRLDDPTAPVRCNGSSWYVDEQFQSYGVFLLLRGIRRQPAVYTNIGPRPHTVPMIAAQGFRIYSSGLFACVPALARAPAVPVRVLSGQTAWQAHGVPVADQRMLADHAAFGCVCLWCETPSGGQPLIVRRRLVKPGVPCAQLIYCRSVPELERVARPVGRFLAARGMPFLLVPANEPMNGVPGRLFPDRLPMYFKGAAPPRPADLSYTEVAVFGM